MKTKTNKGLNISNLFLLDAAGAATTALLLSQLLARYVEFFGMPVSVLMPLATVAAIFAIYSFSMSIQSGNKPKLKLQIIAVANICYCLLTTVLIFIHFQKLTSWGLLYFMGEILIVASLALYEWRFSKRLN